MPSSLTVPDAAPAEHPGPAEPVECTTAFIIYSLPDGRTMVSDDLNVPLVPRRKPSGDDLYALSAIVMKDVKNTEAANMAANATIGFQEIRMRQAMESHQNAMVQQKLQAEEKAKITRAGRR